MSSSGLDNVETQPLLDDNDMMIKPLVGEELEGKDSKTII